MNRGPHNPGDDAEARLEALFADLLSGELALDSPEAEAAIAAGEIDRAELEAMLEVSVALEDRGIVREAAEVVDAPGADLVAATLAREAGLGPAPLRAVPPAEPSSGAPTASPGKDPTLLRIAGLAAAAALLLVVGMKLGGDRSSGQYEQIDPDANLNGTTEPTEGSATYEPATGSLTIPGSYEVGTLFRVTIEAGGEGDSWEQVSEYETESTTSTVPVEDQVKLIAGRTYQVRVVATSVASASPPRRASWELSVE